MRNGSRRTPNDGRPDWPVTLRQVEERLVQAQMSGDVCRAYVIGLGANLGDRRATLTSAVEALAARTTLLAVSHLYESRAVGPVQPDYLNAAVLLEAGLSPGQLLKELLSIERAHGRERRERWGPRTLDLDLLHSPELVVSEPDLTLPHPELIVRGFALAPLVDVAPEATHPVSGARYAELLQAMAEPGVYRVETSDAWFEHRSRPLPAQRPGRAE